MNTPHPNNGLIVPNRKPDFIRPYVRIWFDEMILTSIRSDGMWIPKKMAICPVTNFLMYFESDYPLKYCLLDPDHHYGREVWDAYQDHIIEKEVLGG
jgi:hypothetical protein